MTEEIQLYKLLEEVKAKGHDSLTEAEFEQLNELWNKLVIFPTFRK